MDTPRKLIVGYDLCDDFTQISCFSYKSMEAITIGLREDEDYNPIPTALCVKTETKQWLYGEEALACAANGAGILVDHLLSKLRGGEETEIYNQKFSPEALLEKFIRKTLHLIKDHFPTEPISKIVVTIQGYDPMIADRIYSTLALLGIEKDRAVVMSHADAYLYYALCQDKSLWMNDVGLFDYDEEGLKFYQIRLNRRVRPIIAELSKKDFSDMLNPGIKELDSRSKAYAFENIANTVLYKQLITTLYLTGRGFEGAWPDQVITNLCVGRRVFFGQNLYTKGACYAAKELFGDKSLEDILLLNDDMISSYISVKVYKDTAFTELPLAKAGEIWYEINKSIEVIMEGSAILEIVLNNIMTREVIRERMTLTGLPERPDRMTRLKINLTCRDKSKAVVTVTDLGFGEFYPESGQRMEYTIDI